MSDIFERLQYLQETKKEIKQSINNKGISLSDDIPFREYSNLINEELINKNEISLAEQGKISIILALNNKFDIGLNNNATYSQIVDAIKSIVMKNLQRSFNVTTTLEVGQNILSSNIELESIMKKPTQKTFNTNCVLDITNLKLTTNLDNK